MFGHDIGISKDEQREASFPNKVVHHGGLSSPFGEKEDPDPGRTICKFTEQRIRPVKRGIGTYQYLQPVLGVIGGQEGFELFCNDAFLVVCGDDEGNSRKCRCVPGKLNSAGTFIPGTDRQVQGK